MHRLKQVGRALLGGAITAFGGTFIVPFINQLLVFTPFQNNTKIVLGAVIAYGIAYALADYINERFVKI